MLHSSIGIGIPRGQYYWILGALFGIVLTLTSMAPRTSVMAETCVHVTKIAMCFQLERPCLSCLLSAIFVVRVSCELLVQETGMNLQQNF